MTRLSKAGDVLRQTPGGHVLFCDDVRQEVNGKFIFIGVYTGEMIYGGDFPVVIPQLFACVTYIERPGDGDDLATLHIDGPSGEADVKWFEGQLPDMQSHRHVASENLELDSDADAAMGIYWNITLGPLTILRPGIVKVYVVKGGQKYRIGGLRIVSAQVPNDTASN